MSVIDNEATAINTKTAFAFGNLDIVPPSVLLERTDLYPELRRFADVDNIARLALGKLDQSEKCNVLSSVLVGPAVFGNETEQKLMYCSSFLCFVFRGKRRPEKENNDFDEKRVRVKNFF